MEIMFIHLQTTPGDLGKVLYMDLACCSWHAGGMIDGCIEHLGADNEEDPEKHC